jgi:hypothetical protein
VGSQNLLDFSYESYMYVHCTVELVDRNESFFSQKFLLTSIANYKMLCLMLVAVNTLYTCGRMGYNQYKIKIEGKSLTFLIESKAYRSTCYFFIPQGRKKVCTFMSFAILDKASRVYCRGLFWVLV